jgi:hypothetical protein
LLLPALLDRGAAALPALANLELHAQRAPTSVQRLFEDWSLLAQLTRLMVWNFWGELPPPLPGAPDPGHSPGGMRMEDLDVGGDVTISCADAAALAAWPMPRLRRLALSELEDPAALRPLLHAPWAAGLADLHLSQLCVQSAQGACGRGGVRVQSATFRSNRVGAHACQGHLA